VIKFAYDKPYTFSDLCNFINPMKNK